MRWRVRLKIGCLRFACCTTGETCALVWKKRVWKKSTKTRHLHNIIWKKKSIMLYSLMIHIYIYKRSMKFILKILKNWTTNYDGTFTCQTQSQMTFCSRANGSETHFFEDTCKEWICICVCTDRMISFFYKFMHVLQPTNEKNNRVIRKGKWLEKKSKKRKKQNNLTEIFASYQTIHILIQSSSNRHRINISKVWWYWMIWVALVFCLSFFWRGLNIFAGLVINYHWVYSVSKDGCSRSTVHFFPCFFFIIISCS